MFFLDFLIELVGDAAGAVGNLALAAVNTACDLTETAVETVAEHPVETVLVCIGTVATGGAAAAFSGPIAATIGSTGILGATASGTAISTLSGAALTKASLAAIGGGAIAASGGGMVAGASVIATAGTVVGAAASIGAAASVT